MVMEKFGCCCLDMFLQGSCLMVVGDGGDVGGVQRLMMSLVVDLLLTGARS
jgi:hypothetical protein